MISWYIPRMLESPRSMAICVDCRVPLQPINNIRLNCIFFAELNIIVMLQCHYWLAVHPYHGQKSYHDNMLINFIIFLSRTFLVNTFIDRLFSSAMSLLMKTTHLLSEARPRVIARTPWRPCTRWSRLDALGWCISFKIWRLMFSHIFRRWCIRYFDGDGRILGNKWIVIEEPDDILVHTSNVGVPKKYGNLCRVRLQPTNSVIKRGRLFFVKSAIRWRFWNHGC